jgi:hypothetical protein
MSETDAGFGLMAEFETPEHLLDATRRLRDAGYRDLDAHTPYRVEGLAEALGSRGTSVPWIVLVGGALGIGGAYLLQWWVAAVYYPINVGGRPLNSWPMWVPIMFELGVLVAALAALFAVLALNRLPALYHPVFNVPAFARASQDRFFLVIESADPHFESRRTRRLLEDLGAREVYDVPR